MFSLFEKKLNGFEFQYGNLKCVLSQNFFINIPKMIFFAVNVLQKVSLVAFSVSVSLGRKYEVFF